MAKVYLATEETVAEIRDYVKPTNLNNVIPFIMDFTSPDITIIHGGLDSVNRIITV